MGSIGVMLHAHRITSAGDCHSLVYLNSEVVTLPAFIESLLALGSWHVGILSAAFRCYNVSGNANFSRNEITKEIN